MVLESIHSVLHQTNHHIEIIIVDNLSTDNTLQQLKQLSDSRIKIITEPHLGASYARNTGIRNSSGNILAFLDSDDLWLPEKLELQLSLLKNNHMLFTEYREFTANDKQLLPHRNKLNSSMSLSLITLMIQKDDFLEVGYFDESLNVGEFMEWYSRACALGLQTQILDKTLALRRIHPGNASTILSKKDYAIACHTILSKRRTRESENKTIKASD